MSAVACAIPFLLIEYFRQSLHIEAQILILDVSILLVGLFFHKDEISTRLMGAAVGLFVVFSARFSLLFIVALIVNREWFAFYRFIFLDLSHKAFVIYYMILTMTEILIVFLCRKAFVSLRRIEEAYQYYLAAILVISSLVMNILIWGINRNYSVVITQSAIAMSLAFIMVSCLLSMIMFSRSSALHNEKREKEMVTTMNHIARRGYQKIVQMNEELRAQRHDFKNHLLAIQNMDQEESRQYIQDLLKKQYSHTTFSHTGDAYIDAVLSSKIESIENNQIRYEQNVKYPGTIPISPSDLCAIVSNQLDNAIEACKKIEDHSQRWIRFTIDKKGEMLGIICENAIIPKSVTMEMLKSSTKQTEEHLHGYGIRNIRYCAERNGGEVVHEIKEGSFVSKVLLLLPTAH